MTISRKVCHGDTPRGELCTSVRLVEIKNASAAITLRVSLSKRLLCFLKKLLAICQNPTSK